MALHRTRTTQFDFHYEIQADTREEAEAERQDFIARWGVQYFGSMSEPREIEGKWTCLGSRAQSCGG